MRVHGATVREVIVHSLHEIHETAVGYRLWEKKRTETTLQRLITLLQKRITWEVFTSLHYSLPGRSTFERRLTIVKDNKQWGHKITHPLNITNIQGLPHVTASKNITESNKINNKHESWYIVHLTHQMTPTQTIQASVPRSDRSISVQCNCGPTPSPSPALTLNCYLLTVVGLGEG